MGDTTKMHWTDWRGKERVLEVRHIIDTRDFLGTPGYSLLVVAANAALSVPDILTYLGHVAKTDPNVERGRNWIQRRRRLFQKSGASNRVGPKPNRDGRDARAVEIMRENRRASLFDLVGLLKEAGISRGREWVRMHRCD